MSKEQKSETITLRATPAVRSYLKLLAHKHDQSLAWAVEFVTAQYAGLALAQAKARIQDLLDKRAFAAATEVQNANLSPEAAAVVEQYAKIATLPPDFSEQFSAAEKALADAMDWYSALKKNDD